MLNVVCWWATRALCYLSVKQYRDAVRDCAEALRMDSSNVKALYRRAQAHKELKVSLSSSSCSDSSSSRDGRRVRLAPWIFEP